MLIWLAPGIDGGNPMRRLLLLRHAKSDWSVAGQHDHDRTLNARGRESAPRVGAYMTRHALIPDRVIASTSQRTRETWDLVAASIAVQCPLVYDERLYDATPEAILAVIRECPPNAHSLLIVGHNPGMQEIAALLIAAGDIDARQQLIEKFPTAGLAVIDFPIDVWAKLHPRAGRLDRFVTPRALDTDTD